MPGQPDGSRRVPRRAALAAAGLAAAGAGGLTVAMSTRRGPQRPRSLVLATGPQGAVFIEVGRDLAAAITALSPGTAVTRRVTAATVDNLRLLASSAADLALASLDAAAVDPEVSSGAITAVARLYDSVLHLVVPEESTIRTLTDCAGRRVAVGAAGSGTEFTVLRLLALTGVAPAAQIRLAQAEAMDAVVRGAVDAAFSLTGFPTRAIQDIARTQPVRLVPLGTVAPALEQRYPQIYAPAVIPAGIYTGVGTTATVFVPNLLLARPGLGADAVSLVAEAVLSPSSRQFWTHPDSGRIDIRTAIATGPVRLHPAAVAWLRSAKP